MTDTQVQTVLCRQDNYAYIVTKKAAKTCLLVDAPESRPILRKLDELELELSHVLLTHEHSDHLEGLTDLLESFPKAQVVGISGGKHSSQSVIDGQNLDLPVGEFTCFHTPGHSELCTSYYLPSSSIVFTGDCLFNGGCGRVWGDTHAALFKSLNRLKDLPPDTLIFSGHDYTEKNLEFAKTIESENTDITERLSALGPSLLRTGNTLKLELETNPFLRTSEPSVKLGAGLEKQASDFDTFVALRKKRNSF